MEGKFKKKKKNQTNYHLPEQTPSKHKFITFDYKITRERRTLTIRYTNKREGDESGMGNVYSKKKTLYRPHNL